MRVTATFQHTKYDAQEREKSGGSAGKLTRILTRRDV